MCKCNRVAGIITTGVFTGLAWVILIVSLCFMVTEGTLNILIITLMFTTKSITSGFMINYAANPTKDNLKLNYLTYSICNGIELLILIIYTSVIGAGCGTRCGEGSIIFVYILFGVGMGLKIITNIVSTWNMMVYYNELPDTNLISKRGYQLVILK